MNNDEEMKKKAGERLDTKHSKEKAKINSGSATSTATTASTLATATTSSAASAPSTGDSPNKITIKLEDESGNVIHPEGSSKTLADIPNLKLFLPPDTKFDSSIDDLTIVLKDEGIGDGTLDADLNLKENGDTALTYACKKGLGIVIRELLKNGANPNVPNASGEYPVVLAYGECNKEDFIFLLEKIGIKALGVEVKNLFKMYSTSDDYKITIFDQLLIKYYNMFSGSISGIFSPEIKTAIKKITTLPSDNAKVLLAFIGDNIQNKTRKIKGITMIEADSISIIKDYLGPDFTDISLRIPLIPFYLQNQFSYHCVSAKAKLDEENEMQMVARERIKAKSTSPVTTPKSVTATNIADTTEATDTGTALTFSKKDKTKLTNADSKDDKNIDKDKSRSSPSA